MDVSFAARSQTCQRLFEKLSKISAEFQGADQGSLPTKFVALEDCASRFGIWSTNLGAHHTPRNPKSIDNRLRNTQAISRYLSEVLADLQDTLSDALEIADGQRLDQSVLSSNATLGQHSTVLVTMLQEDDDEVTELSELLSALPNLVSSLFKISMLIRRNTTTDPYIRSIASNPQSSFIPDFDIRHVGDKYPKTLQEPWLQERLGNAISQRRQYLRYRRDHRNRIGHVEIPRRVSQQDEIFQVAQSSSASFRPSLRPPPTECSRPTLASTSASSVAASASIQPISTHDLDEEYAETESRASSFVSSKVSVAGSDMLSVIELQEVCNGATEFECPYCWGIVQARKQRSWKKHVLRDLRAYVCTFKDCNAGLFEDRETWFTHEVDAHRRQWICMACSKSGFPSHGQLRKHAVLEHGHNEDGTEDLTKLMASSFPVEEISASFCPLCDSWDQQLREESHRKEILVPAENEIRVPIALFKRHLAQHQEQLALFAIPPLFKAPERSDSALSNVSQSRSADEVSILARYALLPSVVHVSHEPRIHQRQTIANASADCQAVEGRSQYAFAVYKMEGKRLWVRRYLPLGCG
ncbi:hypothetical protein D0868_01652 [Hortaea werneckii]|uniref:Oxidoreductase acuF-like C2H2 type zinc-finger domain-containing protein n=1 Tax=Hortaea werneckii TaxID=91943 RepID=A0A3M6ZFZ9_HORWE|nr:hypothetical protein D0868_01652 [Hortaea werneckii]